MAPSLLHEVLVHMFRRHPDLLASLGDVPLDAGVRVDDANLTLIKSPKELRADLVLLVGSPPEMAIAVEVQMKPASEKMFTWARYALALQERHSCPATVVVVTPERAVERWCKLGLHFALDGGGFRPTVIGPSTIPVPETQAQANRNPELSVLAALVHGNQKGGKDLLLRVIRALEGLSESDAMIYDNVIYGHLSPSKRRSLEALMSEISLDLMDLIKYSALSKKLRADFFKEARAEVLLEGQQQARKLVMRQLARRLGLLGPELQSRVEALPIERIEALGEALLDFANVDDLKVWLETDLAT